MKVIIQMDGRFQILDSPNRYEKIAPSQACQVFQGTQYRQQACLCVVGPVHSAQARRHYIQGKGFYPQYHTQVQHLNYDKH